ncbi:hypothetical protein [Lacinutrix salivirga]
MKYFLSLILFCVFGFTAIAQDSVEFKVKNEFYIYGDAQAIGNTIMSTHPTEAFNDATDNNDDLEMTYVDVDNDDTTFSSSKAGLSLPDNLEEVVYAGLYWTGTYNKELGIKEEFSGSLIYKSKGKRDNNINVIKFKTPESEYNTITGSVVFDGHNTKEHRINSPYVCYADVTELVKNASTKNGLYTIANVRATQGYVTGGSAAGWMLYVIYKSPTDNPKFITTFDGFALVNKDPVDVTFKNFKSIDLGDSRTSIVVSALEGDASLKRDQCAIIKADGSSFLPLGNKFRRPNNFFNSSISKNGQINTDRVPNSANTLGFDIAELSIPNYNRTIINNEVNETTIRLNTKSDRYYFYFTAFQTEISQTYFNDSPQDIVYDDNTEYANTTNNNSYANYNTNSNTKTTASSTTSSTVNSSSTSNTSSNTYATTNTSSAKKVRQRPVRKSLTSRDFYRLRDSRSAIIEGIDPGYYVVTNVFADPSNVAKWESFLITKGFKPITFINPSNNWHYVYIYASEDIQTAFTTLQDTKQENKLWDTWILKANL